MANNPPSVSGLHLSALLRELHPRLSTHLANSLGPAWSLTLDQFTAAVQRSVAKRFVDCTVDQRNLENYLDTLHIDDLILAASCMQGSEAAWDHFIKTYRGHLRAAAAVITKGSHSGADAQELADSLFAELYGLVDGKRGEASLFRYFHGRSSLKTWLRTILAQRHVDRIRQARRWESLERKDGEPEKLLPGEVLPTPALDPNRNIYLSRFLFALNQCLASLQSGDRLLLELYYARQKTLAEIGRTLGEHESSVSRHLERARRELRSKVEECLRVGFHHGTPSQIFSPMSDAEISLCFQYAAEEVPIDFRQMFPEKPQAKAEAGRKESS